MLMLMPALGEQVIPARMRLSFALALTLVLYPAALADAAARCPATSSASSSCMVHEIVVGLILGGITRLIVMATQVAGAVIAFQAGLSFAQSADPTQGGIQGALIGASSASSASR